MINLIKTLYALRTPNVINVVIRIISLYIRITELKDKYS